MDDGKIRSSRKEMKSVHIGGTNGKGSTVTYLSSILKRPVIQQVHSHRPILSNLMNELV